MYNPDILLFLLIHCLMDNKTLCQLIRQASQSSKKAETLALTIDQIPEIKTYLGKGWLPYYEKALLVTQRDVQRNINKFLTLYRLNLDSLNCQNSLETASVRKYFISWVTMILKRDCHDIKRGNSPRIYSIDEPIKKDPISASRGDIIPSPILSGLDALLANELKNICKQLRQYIELDPDCKLRSCHVRGRPEINCQTLLKLRFLSKPCLTLDSISQQLQTPLQTIKSRLERNCFPLIKDVALRLGYN